MRLYIDRSVFVQKLFHFILIKLCAAIVPQINFNIENIQFFFFLKILSDHNKAEFNEQSLTFNRSVSFQ